MPLFKICRDVFIELLKHIEFRVKMSNILLLYWIQTLSVEIFKTPCIVFLDHLLLVSTGEFNFCKINLAID